MEICLALVLCLVHLFAEKMRFLEGIPRSRWLSLAGGASVAYVFLHLLPELGEGQRTIEQARFAQIISFIEVHAYAAALVGLIAFYGLERTARLHRRAGVPTRQRPTGVFWVHIVSFSIYNALIGYLLLHREDRSARGLILFVLAMALHFVVNDYGLRQHFAQPYRRLGRWVLSAAVLVGVACGYVIEVSEAALAVCFALLAGGVMLNVLKEELPEERQSRFGAFVLGAIAYSALLLVS